MEGNSRLFLAKGKRGDKLGCYYVDSLLGSGSKDEKEVVAICENSLQLRRRDSRAWQRSRQGQNARLQSWASTPALKQG